MSKTGEEVETKATNRNNGSTVDHVNHRWQKTRIKTILIRAYKRRMQKMIQLTQ